MPNLPYFNGQANSPQNTINDLPTLCPGQLTHPRDYLASEELAAAVNVALTLGMPLLLTGEPGCGKSELARRIAWEIGAEPIYPEKEKDVEEDLKTRVLKYVVKSTTEAKDLFYTFDTLGRFHAAHTAQLLPSASEAPESESQGSEQQVGYSESNEPNHYIEYQALGLALLRAKGQENIPEGICSKKYLATLPEKPQRSVVLIDEIDKAPRDVPNDILSEIENMEFTVAELHGAQISLENKEQAFRPIVIITSNSERDLPPAFLRRCVYYHVPFPPFASELSAKSETQNTRTTTIEDIVHSRFGKRYSDWPKLNAEALSLCHFLRSHPLPLVKKPSLAEVLNWLTYLENLPTKADHLDKETFGLTEFNEADVLVALQATLLKTEADQARGKELLDEWHNKYAAENATA